MNQVSTEASCPLCKVGTQTGEATVYDCPVCRGCASTFANRRRLAFLLDLFLLSLPAVFLPGVIGLALWPFRDALWGRSPGKRLFGLAVYDLVTLEPATISASIKRNLVFGIPLVGWCVAVTQAIGLARGPRIGDIWAATVVIPEMHSDQFMAALRQSPLRAEAILNCAARLQAKGDLEAALQVYRQVANQWKDLECARDVCILIDSLEKELERRSGGTAWVA